jgi:phage gp16-like protein
VISIVQLIKKCSVSDALKYLSQFVCITEKSSSKKLTIKRENYRIIKVQEVKHPTLVDYLKFRKVFEQKDLVKEVYYEMGGKQYFGIGFENQSGDLKFVILIQKSVLAKKILHSFNRIQKF